MFTKFCVSHNSKRAGQGLGLKYYLFWHSITLGGSKVKKTVLLIAFLSFFAISGCFAAWGYSGYEGYWHCMHGACHWHEPGVTESYYVPFYGRPYYVAPAPPPRYITPRYYYYHRRYSPPPPAHRMAPAPPHHHRRH